jgi:general secretion pathway protein C
MLSKQLPLIAAILIILLSAASVGLQLYPFYLESQTPNISIQAKPDQPTQDTTNKPKYNVAAFKMFGDYNAQPQPKADTLKKIPTTKLKLRLTGVSADKEQKLGSALIEDPKRDTERYVIGDELPGGAKLHEVYQDRIILSRGGKLETLFFPETSGGPQLLTATTANEPDYRDSEQVMPTVMGGIPTNVDEKIINTNELPKITPAQKQNIRDRLSALRARLKQQ